MNPAVMKALLEFGDAAIKKKEKTDFDWVQLDDADQHKIDLTLKSYGFSKGLSTKIHKTGTNEGDDLRGNQVRAENDTIGKNELFYIKGPMGRGL